MTPDRRIVKSRSHRRTGDSSGQVGVLDDGEADHLGSLDDPSRLGRGHQVGSDWREDGLAAVRERGPDGTGQVRQGLTLDREASVGQRNVKIERGSLGFDLEADGVI